MTAKTKNRISAMILIGAGVLVLAVSAFLVYLFLTDETLKSRIPENMLYPVAFGTSTVAIVLSAFLFLKGSARKQEDEKERKE